MQAESGVDAQNSAETGTAEEVPGNSEEQCRYNFHMTEARLDLRLGSLDSSQKSRSGTR